MLGTVMFISKLVMEFLPNIHLIGMFLVVFTLVFRLRALVPLYVFVFLSGIYAGFSPWWVPYLYIWLPLWALAMLIPKKLPIALKGGIGLAMSAFHGLTYGALYAPLQAWMFGLDFNGMLAWIAAGFPFDALHCAGNSVAGVLIAPLAMLIAKVARQVGMKTAF